MAIEKVREYFKKFGISENILEFEVSSATVELAAQALKTDENRIAKSLSFMLEKGPIIIVTAGDARIYNGAFKRYFNEKAKMLSYDEVHNLIGHDVGGVCPFALNTNVDVYLDVSLKRFKTVFPAAGSSNSAIELTCDELEKYCSNFISWVDVCKDWQTL